MENGKLGVVEKSTSQSLYRNNVIKSEKDGDRNGVLKSPDYM